MPLTHDVIEEVVQGFRYLPASLDVCPTDWVHHVSPCPAWTTQLFCILIPVATDAECLVGISTTYVGTGKPYISDSENTASGSVLVSSDTAHPQPAAFPSVITTLVKSCSAASRGRSRHSHNCECSAHVPHEICSTTSRSLKAFHELLASENKRCRQHRLLHPRRH